jgi:hypothetical protein
MEIPIRINMGSGGNSNHEILLDILNFEFKPLDLCIVCWSFSNRELLYEKDMNIKTMFQLHAQKDDSFYRIHTLYDLQCKSREYIHHAELYLDSIGIRYRMGKIEYHLSKNYKWNNYNYETFIDFFIIDYAIDNSHPGIESNKLFAKKLYDSLR